MIGPDEDGNWAGHAEGRLWGSHSGSGSLTHSIAGTISNDSYDIPYPEAYNPLEEEQPELPQPKIPPYKAPQLPNSVFDAFLGGLQYGAVELANSYTKTFTFGYGNLDELADQVAKDNYIDDNTRAATKAFADLSSNSAMGALAGPALSKTGSALSNSRAATALGNTRLGQLGTQAAANPLAQRAAIGLGVGQNAVDAAGDASRAATAFARGSTAEGFAHLGALADNLSLRPKVPKGGHAAPRVAAAPERVYFDINDDLSFTIYQRYCFVAGTPVSTESGLRPIESIAAGEKVWSFDLSTHQWRLCTVRKTFTVDHEGDLYDVSVGGDTNTSSYHHPYWVVEGERLADRPTPEHVLDAMSDGGDYPGRWVDAGDLRVGDVLLLRDGRRERVDGITIRQSVETLYNFAVEDLHNYAVGTLGVLVHNNCYDELVEAAKLKYPNKAIKADELHHIDPKYLGGPKDGPTVPLNPAYHQEITNAFRELQPYGKLKEPLSPEALQELKDIVYSRFPLPPGTVY